MKIPAMKTMMTMPPATTPLATLVVYLKMTLAYRESITEWPIKYLRYYYIQSPVDRSAIRTYVFTKT